MILRLCWPIDAVEALSMVSVEDAYVKVFKLRACPSWLSMLTRNCGQSASVSLEVIWLRSRISFYFPLFREYSRLIELMIPDPIVSSASAQGSVNSTVIISSPTFAYWLPAYLADTLRLHMPAEET